MSGATAIVTAASAALAAGAGVYRAHSANKANKRAKRDSAIALQRTEDQIKKAEERQAFEDSRADAKTPEQARKKNVQKSKGGVASTLLTGPTGVASEDLALSRNTLLGS